MVPDFWLVAIDGRNCLTPEFTDAALEFLNGFVCAALLVRRWSLATVRGCEQRTT